MKRAGTRNIFFLLGLGFRSAIEHLYFYFRHFLSTYQLISHSKYYGILQLVLVVLVGFVVFVGGFVGGFGWFWLIPCFSNYDSIHRSLICQKRRSIHESQINTLGVLEVTRKELIMRCQKTNLKPNFRNFTCYHFDNWDLMEPKPIVELHTFQASY